jgi:hypothetical protein
MHKTTHNVNMNKAIPIPLPGESPTVAMWPTAGQSVGLQKSATFDAYHKGTLPFPVIRAGGKLRVPTAALRRLLELDGPSSQPDLTAVSS